LVLKIEQSQQLLFTNMAGIKVLQLSYAEFSQLLAQRKVVALYSGASFSLCLAEAVGVDSVEILEALASAMGISKPEPVEEPEPEPELTPKEELAQLVSEQMAAQKSEQAPEPVPELMPEPVPEQMPEQEDSQKPDLVELKLEAQDHAPEESPAQRKEPHALGTSTAESGFLSVQAEEIKAQGGYALQPAKDHPAEASGLPERTTFEKESRKFIAEDVDKGGSQDQPAEQNNAVERQINLPMGVWIGFHDGETPMMARLAVHDTDHDNFVFVNRKGIKIRQASLREMLSLIDQGLLEILETKSNFKEEVTEVRKKMDP
jgi:hypothetical protein